MFAAYGLPDYRFTTKADITEQLRLACLHGASVLRFYYPYVKDLTLRPAIERAFRGGPEYRRLLSLARRSVQSIEADIWPTFPYACEMALERLETAIRVAEARPSWWRRVHGDFAGLAPATLPCSRRFATRRPAAT